MKEQNYKNHRKFYIPHHVVFYGLVTAGICVCVKLYNNEPSIYIAFIGFLFFMLGFLSFMLRQHYALGNQDRIVRIEMRFRYYVLTGKRLELLEDKLSFGQIAALRFASDAELPVLLDRAIKEGLKPNQIKQNIKDWQADHMRV